MINQRTRANLEYRGRGAYRGLRGAPRGYRGASRGNTRGGQRGFRDSCRGEDPSFTMSHGSHTYEVQQDTFIPSKDSEIRMYKVSLCKWITEGKECHKSDKCTYAHTEEEQRKPHDPILLSRKEEIEELYANKEIKENNREKGKKKIDKSEDTLRTFLYDRHRDLEGKYNAVCAQLRNIDNAWERKLEEAEDDFRNKENELKRVSFNKEQTIRSLKIHIKSLETRNSQLESDSAYRRLQNLTAKHKELINKLYYLEAKLDRYQSHCENLCQTTRDSQRRYDILKSSNSIKSDKFLYAPSKNYKELLCDFIAKVDSAFECPLSCDKLRDPVILPSGHTINSDFYEKLIKSKARDPYNKSYRLTHAIVNRLAIQIQEIMDYVKIKKTNLEEQNRCSNIGLQVDLNANQEENPENNTEADFEENKSLMKNFKELEKIDEKELIQEQSDFDEKTGIKISTNIPRFISKKFPIEYSSSKIPKL
ncbi:unnamed protein product [Moneuplotes crassus]|uniref:C3H1-type domain-containing protein n=1 Tax=Euplotes crassus TaxID=5936 RepID=A0AAD1X963_EUPCR|nr:unnamed protein product [Moneuplotes crassus]